MPLSVHHQHEHVGLCAADLETEATAFHADGSGRGPADAVFLAAGHESFSVFRADDERAFFQSRHDHDALRAC